jgi:DHA3 family macrolide efflux protein-like MFS transporter
VAALVPPGELARVQGYNQALGGAIEIVGPPLGALALAVLALHQVMAVDVVTAILAIVPLLFVRIPEPMRSAATATASVWHGTVDGLRYIRALPGIPAIIVVVLMLNFVGAPMGTLLPLYIRDVFGGDAADLGLIQSGFGVGLIAGGILLSAWGGPKRHRTVTALAGIALSQIGTLGVAAAPVGGLWVVAGSWALFAVFNALVNGTFGAMLQTAVSGEMQGRVQSVIQSGAMLATPLGLALAVPVTNLLGLRFWYWFAGVAAIAGSLLAMTFPQVRQLDAITDAAARRSMAVPEGAPAE